MPLVIVESPTKAKTIQKFLDSSYHLLATRGHIRDLPKSKLGIDIEHDFTPQYLIPSSARKTVKELKEEIKKHSLIILATDEDREGEAIAWHVAVVSQLNPQDYQRITFHEITPEAIKEALQNPKKISFSLVEAQQARRLLDRLVGYKLSPFLWKKVMRRLSAGRVQSATLHLIAKREAEIEKFQPQQYWTIEASFKKTDSKEELEAQLIAIKGKKIPPPGLLDQREVQIIKKELAEENFQTKKLLKKEKKISPPAPFRTSTLQTKAGHRLHFSSKRTMSLAQKLYEKGLISYHRTDSTFLATSFLQQAEKYLSQQGEKENWEKKNFRQKVKGGQEAHEAIRPTHLEETPDKLKNKLPPADYRLYQLIWQRSLASQMKPMVVDQISLDIEAGDYLLRATGQSIKAKGFSKIYPQTLKEKILPSLKEGEELQLLKVQTEEHFTRPPARYSEPSLIKELEKLGLGRPSTYSPIISTILSRNYVQKKERRFFLTKIGKIVDEILSKHFPKIVDSQFTAQMEEKLDKIAQGKETASSVIKDFYQPFIQNLEKKYKEVKKLDLTEPTNEKCPLCGAPLIKRTGRYGEFYACSNFPKCKYTAPLPSQKTGIKCPQCQKGEIIEKKNRRGQTFYACSNYPQCKFTLSGRPTGEKCPQCGSLLIQDKRGGIKCSNPQCSYRKKVPEKKSSQ
jgi:DNA topoisomerase I